MRSAVWRISYRALAICFLVTIAGCTQSTDPVFPLQVNVSPQLVSAGETVTVELNNSGLSVLEFRHNDFELQRKISGLWSYVWKPGGGFDTNEVVLPGGKLSLTLAIPATAPSGTYRVLFPRVSEQSSSRITERASNQFSVTAK